MVDVTRVTHPPNRRRMFLPSTSRLTQRQWYPPKLPHPSPSSHDSLNMIRSWQQQQTSIPVLEDTGEPHGTDRPVLPHPRSVQLSNMSFAFVDRTRPFDHTQTYNNDTQDPLWSPSHRCRRPWRPNWHILVVIAHGGPDVYWGDVRLLRTCANRS